MPKYSSDEIRNVAFVGHGGAGKTTLVESILHITGTINQPGHVEKGNTVCDYDAEEKEHQHSLAAAVVHCDHGGVHYNLIDTPGFPDFIGQALCCLPAVETAAVVINAQQGIEMVTRRMMDRAGQAELCRLIVINKINAENINLGDIVNQVRETFGSECLPINLPTGGGTGVIDVFQGSEGDADFSSVADAHTEIVDQVVETDEALMEKYLESGEVSPDELKTAFARALAEGHLVPICFTAAQDETGVKELVELLSLMPSASQGTGAAFEKVEGEETKAYRPEAKPDAPVLGHLFKVTTDPFVGKLGFFRIWQGTATKDTQLYINDARKPFKIGHLLKLQGKEHSDTDAGVPGDICAVAKIEEIELDALLHEEESDGSLKVKTIDYPTPMSGFAIEAKSRGDEQKISRALTALEAEDPCFRVERDATTHETVIRGLGDLHLRVVLEKMKNRFNVEVDTRPPKIAYRETIGGKAEGHHRHKKQTGGAGQFGEVFPRVEPMERGEGFEFVNDIFGGAIPQQFLPAIEKGVRQVLEDGAIAGYPMQDVRVSVYDGKHHPVDSKEVAFVTAGKRAFIDAINKAKPQVLEPIVHMEVIVPEENMGDIASDLSGKRGRIQGQDTLPGGMISIKAQAPLAELGNYQSQLKSVTGGQGTFTMEFSHYEPLPPQVQQQLVAQFKPKEDED